MVNLQLYIEGEHVELFEDEAITIVDSIQNVRDISKIFTAFSKTFNVPASKANNKIFKHFYNPDITEFDASEKVDAQIHVNYQLYKKGKIKLESVKTRYNKAESYRVTFFGNTVQLKDLIGEDNLNQLDLLAEFKFDYTSDNILSHLKNTNNVTIGATTYNDPLIVPLITHTDRLYYDSTLAENNTNNLYYVSDSQISNGVKYSQLKPAIRLYVIIKAIENKYGLEFSDDFFNTTTAEFYNLYMWLHKEEGGLTEKKEAFADFQGATVTGLQGDGASYFYAELFDKGFWVKKKDKKDTLFLKIEITTTSTEAYRYVLYKDNEELESFDGITGNKVVSTDSGTDDFDRERIDREIGVYRIAIEGEANATYTVKVTKRAVQKSKLFNPVHRAEFTGTVSINALDEVNTMTQLPEMKVLDFLTGVFKMFNLTAFVDNDNKIIVKPLDDYYADGTSYNITEYIDNAQAEVSTVIPFSAINFSYEGLETKLAEQHKEQFKNQEWGNTQYIGNDINKFEGGEYTVKIPFEHFKYERIYDDASAVDINNPSTTIQWGWSVDVDDNSVVGKPLLFYPIKVTDGTAISFVGSSSKQSIDDYRIPSNALDVTNSQNLHFNTFPNEYKPTILYDKTLFNTYYKSYIEEVFNRQKRTFKFNAYLPPRILANLELSDKFIIFDREYRINSIQTNLKTGLSQLELLNIVVADFTEEQFENYVTADTTLLTADTTSVNADATL